MSKLSYQEVSVMAYKLRINGFMSSSACLQKMFHAEELLIVLLVALWKSVQDHVSHLSASGTSSNPKSWMLLGVPLAQGDVIDKEAIEKHLN